MNERELREEKKGRGSQCKIPKQYVLGFAKETN